MSQKIFAHDRSNCMIKTKKPIYSISFKDIIKVTEANKSYRSKRRSLKDQFYFNKLLIAVREADLIY